MISFFYSLFFLIIFLREKKKLLTPLLDTYKKRKRKKKSLLHVRDVKQYIPSLLRLFCFINVFFCGGGDCYVGKLCIISIHLQVSVYQTFWKCKVILFDMLAWAEQSRAEHQFKWLHNIDILWIIKITRRVFSLPNVLCQFVFVSGKEGWINIWLDVGMDLNT